MRRFRKLAAGVFIAAMMVSLAACGKDESEKKPAGGVPETTPTAAEQATPTNRTGNAYAHSGSHSGIRL